MEKIVVGVDGSEGAEAALEFAAHEAALRAAGLRIVSAWEIPAGAYGGGFAPPLDAETLDAFRIRAEQVADEAYATIRNCSPRSKQKRSRFKGNQPRCCSIRLPTQR